MRVDDLLAGIMLPDSIFEQEWMWYLGAFVAFNTVVFVGLSLGKFIPWPPQPSKTTLDEWRNRTSRNGPPEIDAGHASEKSEP
ncbi:MAG: hypothetical protein K9G28_00945 [Candidatus Nanopelagicales bacterium]|nr:hypothetical protein [Candidatus Nanopelagicales bacterium]